MQVRFLAIYFLPVALLSALVLSRPVVAEEAPAAERPRKGVGMALKQHSARLKSVVLTWCGALERDRRLDLVVAPLSQVVAIDSQCMACRPLFKVIAETCDPALIAKAKEKEAKRLRRKPTPTPVVTDEESEEELESGPMATPTPIVAAQREPSIAVLTATEGFISSLWEREELREEYAIALKKFTLAMRSRSEQLSPAAREYQAYILVALETPFRELLDQVARQLAPTPTPRPTISVEEFFDF